MELLYVGTEDRLDWTRRKILISAGHLVIDIRSMAEIGSSAKAARLVVLSNLLPKQKRDEFSNFLSSQYPDILRLAFYTSDSSPEHGEYLPPQLDPDGLLKVVGSALMRQHHHPEVQSKYFLYVDYRRRYISVSDGIVELTGFSREEILGKSIEWLTYGVSSEVPAQFQEYLAAKKMAGSYVLRSSKGEPVPVTFNATVLADGCLCSELSPTGNIASPP